MKKFLCFISLFAFLVLAGEAMAYSISLSPVNQTIYNGEKALLDVNLTLVNESLFGFDLKLSFVDTILGFNNLTFISALSSYFPDFTYDSFSDPKTVSFNGFDLGATPTTGTVTLASLSFTGLGLGTSPLSLTGTLDLGSLDTTGNFILDTAAASGSTNVVPEPGTFLLLGLGLAGLVGLRRKYQGN